MEEERKQESTGKMKSVVLIKGNKNIKFVNTYDFSSSEGNRIVMRSSATKPKKDIKSIVINDIYIYN